jgi:hypothetical protein
MAAPDALARKLSKIWPHLDERARRMMAANEARALCYGGVSAVSRACGLSRATITKAIRELDDVVRPCDDPLHRRNQLGIERFE